MSDNIREYENTAFYPREDSEELKFLYRVKEFVETVLKGRIEYAKGDELMSDLYDRIQEVEMRDWSISNECRDNG